MDVLVAVLIIGAALVLVLLVVLSRGGSVVAVNDQVDLAQSREHVERYAFGPLGSIPGAVMAQAVPGQATLVAKRTPTWAVFVGILAFPIGLLLLLLVRQDLVLHVRFLDHGTGTTVQVAGRTRRRVAVAVGETFNRLASSLPR